MCESWNICLAWSLGDKVLERKVMLEQSMAFMELKKAMINHETSPAPTHWARFGDYRNQLVSKYISNVVLSHIISIHSVKRLVQLDLLFDFMSFFNIHLFVFSKSYFISNPVAQSVPATWLSKVIF